MLSFNVVNRFEQYYTCDITVCTMKERYSKLMNKYLVSWTLLFPEKKVFLMCPPGRPGPGRCVWPLRSAPGRLGEPSQQGPGPAVAAPKQALVWIYSSSVRPLTNQYKLTLVTCAHRWTPCVRTNSALHKTILSKLLCEINRAKRMNWPIASYYGAEFVIRVKSGSD